MGEAASSSRIVELDGVRGLAALLVVYCHLFLIWVPADPTPVFWLRTLSGLSWTGVHLFFILSGYLIGGILLRQRESPNYFSAFYCRRAFRILPLYFFVLAVFFVARSVFGNAHPTLFANGPIPLWSYPALVQNFPMAATCHWGAPPLSVTWSVALEEQFYLFLPLLVWLLATRFQLATWIIIAGIGPLFRAFVPVCHAPFLLPGSFEPLFAGVMLAWASLHRPQIFQRTHFRVIASTLWVISGLGMAALAVGKLKPGLLEVSLITMFWGAFLWLVLANLDRPLTALLRAPALRWIGTISYGVYLFHPLVNEFLFHAAMGSGPAHGMGWRGFALACGSLLIVLLISAASFFLAERRLIAIGHRFRYQPPRSAQRA